MIDSSHWYQRKAVGTASFVRWISYDRKKNDESSYLRFDFSWNFQVGWVRDSKNTVTKDVFLSKYFYPCL